MLLIVALSVATVCWAATPENDIPQISVSGTAVTQTVPDVIQWSITITDENKDLQEAKRNSDAKMAAILTLARELGVRPEDLQTGYLNANREYNQDERGRRLDFKGFSVRRGVTLKQRDLKRFDEYLTKLVSSAEMEVSFSFDSSRMTDLRWETRLKALKAAKEKAEAMAKVVDATAGKVIRIEEPLPPEGRYGGGAYGSFANTSFADPQAARPADVAQGTFAPGAIEVKVTVNAIFELESRRD
ncbi:MAG: SIMPL domain-containing protein [Candidatus Hydrogenedentes bacterium]|nr:SIMPL domain-containing protein [Candidatus Hydrogenedentota bacterium]